MNLFIKFSAHGKFQWSKSRSTGCCVFLCEILFLKINLNMALVLSSKKTLFKKKLRCPRIFYKTRLCKVRVTENLTLKCHGPLTVLSRFTNIRRVLSNTCYSLGLITSKYAYKRLICNTLCIMRCFLKLYFFLGFLYLKMTVTIKKIKCLCSNDNNR